MPPMSPIVFIERPLTSRDGVRLATGDFLQRVEHSQAPLARDAHHLVRTRRWAAHAQYRIAMLEQPFRDRVEDLVERLVAHAARARERDEGEGEPLSHGREVARAEKRQ